MLEIEDALARILQRVAPLAAEEVDLMSAPGRWLAEPLVSDIDSPPHDKAMMDGYAVRSADLDDLPRELRVVETVAAGDVPWREIGPGEATRIMTGAPIPSGADAVIKIESTERLGDDPPRARILEAVSAGANILPRSTALACGEEVLPAGRRLRAIDLGLLAEIGKATLSVHRQPQVAILATGNELVPPRQIPAVGQIRNSNGPLLTALAIHSGATAVDLGIARDEPETLRDRIGQGLASDVLLLSGGVSAGDFDLVPRALAEQGVVEVFHKVRLKPGKPLWFGVREGDSSTLVFGLPGNPVSSMVCFEMFVRPALARLGGGDGSLPTLWLPLAAEFIHRGDRNLLFPARIETDAGTSRVRTLPWQGSADLSTLLLADAWAWFPPESGRVPAGVAVRCLPLPS